jgi:predicted ABC-type ATPase
MGGLPSASCFQNGGGRCCTQEKMEVLAVNSEDMMALGVQDLLDVFDDFRDKADLARCALATRSKKEDVAQAILKMLAERDSKFDKNEFQDYISENLVNAFALLNERTEKTLQAVLSRIDEWKFDTTGRVDAAPKLEKDLSALRVSLADMSTIRAISFCLRPPRLHNYSSVSRLSENMFAGKDVVPKDGTRQPFAIVTVGAPGSGKDYTIVHREQNSCLEYLLRKFDGPETDQYVLTDPDYWISSLCENNNAHRDVANFLNLENFFCAIGRRNHIVFNATGKDIKNTAGRVASRLLEANYKIYVVVVLAKFSVVMERIDERMRRTGRAVPEPIVKSIFEGLQKAVPIYLRNQAKMCDAILIYSNNGDERSTDPQLVLRNGDDPQKAIDMAAEMLAVPP